MGARAGDDQRLRPHRDHDVAVHERPADTGVGCAADRFTGARGGVVRAGRVAAAGAGRCGRRVVSGRPRRRRRILAPGRVDRVTIRGLPVRRARGADVSHRRPGAVGRRRAAAVSRARRRTGQDPRLPHRTRRDPGSAGRARRRGAGGGHRPRGPPRRQAPGRLYHRTHRGSRPGRGAYARWPSGCRPTWCRPRWWCSTRCR